MIRRSYSPPFQARAPQLGVDDLGAAVKGLVSVEVNRTNEISFAVESFGCDGKPVLSMLRGLDCESPGKLVMAGTKGGMPFKLGSDLPRGAGSAIRGTGGGLVQVTGGVAMLTREWVLYDNYGNHWSLDQGTTPVYLGETPPLANGDGVTPATCDMDPKIRPYWKVRQWVNTGSEGGPGDFLVRGYTYEIGWQDDAIGSPVVTYNWDDSFGNTNIQWRVYQWVPDETTPPDGTGASLLWPGCKQRAVAVWHPTYENDDLGVGYYDESPHYYDGSSFPGVAEVVTEYPALPPYEIIHNQFTRPLVEQISAGGITGESTLVICIEKTYISPSPSIYTRMSLRSRTLGTLIANPSSYPAGFLRTDHRHFFTPKADEGWYAQNGVVSSGAVKIYRYHSRTSTANAYGTALSYRGSTTVTLPPSPVHAWDAEPVWFRVGRVTRSFGNTRLTPLLPRW